VEGQSLQGIAYQDGRRLVESFVTGWTPATKVVIVHCRQVIVYERVDMYELDGAGRAFDLLLGTAYRAGGSEQQPGPDTFATAQDAVAHRLV